MKLIGGKPLLHFTFWLSFILLSFGVTSSYIAHSQPGTGLPVTLFSPTSSSGLQLLDWRVSPPQAHSIPGTGPTDFAAAVPAINRCGEPVFLVVHSGITNRSTDLFIYDLQGNALLDDNTPNGPGLNGKKYAIEMQVIPVPGKSDEWYIFYAEWKSDSGAPLGNGAYVPAPALYSRVRYACGEITVLERDVALKANGTIYTYTNAMGISTRPDGSGLCLYLTRRSSSNNNISLDRFNITSAGITFDKNTGNISAQYWLLTCDGSALEVSHDGKRVAIINRNQDYGWIGILLFDALAFNTNPANCQLIYFGDLILQPDYNILSLPGSIDDISATNSNLYFLSNLERKVVDIEFSPSGEYLYFVYGGFVEGYYTNISYLGQIKIGTVANPEPYPFEVRLQIQEPPDGIYDPYTGRGGLEASYVNDVPAIIRIEMGYDGNMYFIKRDRPYLYVMPDPDNDLPQMLVPGDVDLSTPSKPNILIDGIHLLFSDQIDGYDYDISNNPAIFLGNDTAICTPDIISLTPGNQFESYCWQDGSTNPVYNASISGEYWVEVIDEFGCFAYDTIEVTVGSADIFLGNDTVICTGSNVPLSAGGSFVSYTWQDGSGGSAYNATTAGIYWCEVTDASGCTDRDSIRISTSDYSIFLGDDLNICEGDNVILSPGTGYDSYLWQDGSTATSYFASSPGLYWVEISIAAGCTARDSVVIEFAEIPEVNLGPDTLIGFDQTVLLNAGEGFVSYLWQDGSTGQDFEASAEGVYWVTVSNGFCSSSDSIVVYMEDCTANLFIPNCFTPNGDGYNETFLPASQNLTNYTMLIFNRWGQQLFETSDVNEGWTGKVNGRLSPQGTYFYLINFTTVCESGLEQSGVRKGSVTLLE